MNCYLAGTITGSVINECRDWRKKIVLHYMNWKGNGTPYKDLTFFDPCHGEAEISIDGMKSNIPTKVILDKDYNAIKKSDLFIANMDMFGVERAPIGTIMEIAFAYDFRKPIILICETNSLYRQHPFVLNMVSWYFETVDEMLEKKAINQFYKAWNNPNYV